MFSQLVAQTKPVGFERDDEDFRSVAIKWHADQKYGDLPYGYHLAWVESFLVNNNYNDLKYRAAAWLHDAIEDTKMTYNLIFALYGGDVAAMVWACSGVGENRKARNQSIFDKLREFPMAAPVKVADRFCNMAFSFKNKSRQFEMYMKEFPEFMDNVRPLMMDTVKDSQAWFKLENFYHTVLPELNKK